MKSAIEWLLGLERVRLDGDSVLSLRFESPPAAWIMLIGAVVAAVLVYRLYRRQRVASRWRWGLMFLRFSVIMTALFMLSRPVIVLQRNEVERSVVAVMIDSSGSMLTTDVPQSQSANGPAKEDVPNGAGRESASRWSAAVQSVFSSQGGLASRLISRHDLDVWTFNSGATRVGRARNASELDELARRIDQSAIVRGATDLASSLLQVMDAGRSTRLAGVVVLSDGRQSANQSVESALAVAEARGVGIYTIAAGSSRARPDVEVSSVWAVSDVFVRDAARVQCQLDLRGVVEALRVMLQLRDKATGQIFAERAADVAGGAMTWRGELLYSADAPGLRTLTVAALPLAGEENVENNEADLTIKAHDATVSVLYVEGDPRFEYRFLKNLLIREATLDSSILLLSATAGFAQEGTRPITRFPQSIDELGRYDVVILGDVDPHGDWISPVQESMLVDFVSNQGGGLAFIAGERHMPQQLRRSKLERLLPARLSPTFDGSYGREMTEPFRLRLTAEGRDSAIFRLADADVSLRDAPMTAGWYWYSTVRGAAPGAVVLATHPSAQAENESMPLVVLGRFGAGRTFYLGSDDAWRWRQYGGEAFHQHFWLQVIRTLARGKRFGAQGGWRIETDRRRYELGSEVQVELLAGDSQEASLPVYPRVVVTDDTGAPIERVELRRVEGSVDRARGSFNAIRTGTLKVEAEDFRSALNQEAPSRLIVVRAVDREMDRREADDEFLMRLAHAGGGRTARLGDDLSEMIDAIPDRSVQIPADIEEAIWDTKFMLILFTLLIGAEWVTRKAMGLA
ncbi:MAG: hypothetical protein KF841_04120 [Phycisphaerae bacterium]|nr:hypothetical protein [Phycisphaerae bacterium]